MSHEWDTLAFTQKCDASTWMLQNTSKSDRESRDTSTELGKQEKSGLKISEGDFFMDHERSCLRSLFTRSDTVEKQNLPANAFRFPEFIETSPLKREGGTEKTHCPKSPRCPPPSMPSPQFIRLHKYTRVFNKFCGALRWADSTPCGPKRVGGTDPGIMASLELNRSRTHKEDGHGIADIMKATP